jgi:hypothetical protein
MKKSVSLLSNLLLSSTLFWGVPMAHGEELGSEEILRVPAEDTSYCHMKFPTMREDSLSWTPPVFDESAVPAVDFYGPCDHDPLGIDAVKTERRIRLRGIYGDGE